MTPSAHTLLRGELMEQRMEQKLRIAVLVVIMLGALAAVAALEKGRAVPQPIQAEAPALPLSGWRILVDAGHGGYDGGARAVDSGVWEKKINLQVALAVEKALTNRGAAVLMTRTEDVDLTSADRPAGKTMKRQDMENRVALAVDGAADMVLSIHMNEYRSRRESGPQVFYREGADESRLLAGCLQAALIAELHPAKERTAMAGDYFILRLDVPSALIECGFISNAAEEKLLLDDAYQQRLAQAIADGVEEFVRLKQPS